MLGLSTFLGATPVLKRSGGKAQGTLLIFRTLSTPLRLIADSRHCRGFGNCNCTRKQFSRVPQPASWEAWKHCTL